MSVDGGFVEFELVVALSQLLRKPSEHVAVVRLLHLAHESMKAQLVGVLHCWSIVLEYQVL